MAYNTHVAYKYNIYIGGCTVASIAPIIIKHGIKAATMIPIQGIWEGELESGVMIEVVLLDGKQTIPAGLFVELKQQFAQNCLLVTCTAIAADLV